MELWRMLSQILLTLAIWQHGMVSGHLESEDEIDQLATASDIQMRNVTAWNSALRMSNSGAEMTTVHYENSNGFVPITPETRRNEERFLKTRRDSVNDLDTSNDHLSLFFKMENYSETNDEDDDDDESSRNDPFSTTETKMTRGIARQNENRRYYDAQEFVNDFDLLRITNHTPNVAGYDYFSNGALQFSEANHQPNVKEWDDTGELGRQRNIPGNVDYSSTYGNDMELERRRNVTTTTTTNNRYFPQTRTRDDGGYKRLKNRMPMNVQVDETGDYEGQDTRNEQHFRHATMQNFQRHEVNDDRFNTRNAQSSNSPNVAKQRNGKQRASHSNVHSSKFDGSRRSHAKSAANSNPYAKSRTVKNRNENMDDGSTRVEDNRGYLQHEALFGREGYEKVEETSKESSDENYEYVEVTERPKRYRKRKRPNESKRLPKEHREDEDSSDIEQFGGAVVEARPTSPGRTQLSKTVSYSINHEDDSEDEDDAAGAGTVTVETRNRQTQKSEKSRKAQNHRTRQNGWESVSPTVEVAQSTSIELDQTGKPKIVVPVKLNIVPVANFDHATALGNSQGFDFSNAVLQNIVTATPITFTAAPPLLNSVQNTFQQNFGKNLQNLQQLQNPQFKIQNNGVDTIGDQSTFHNSVQTLLVPTAQDSHQNQLKLAQNFRHSFVNANQSPQIFLQSQNLNAHQQQTPVRVIQQSFPPQNVIPISGQKPGYDANANFHQTFQNSLVNHVSTTPTSPRFVDPQPTLQTFEHLVQNGGQAQGQIVQVSPNGLQGHNTFATQHLSLGQSIPSSTTPVPRFIATPASTPQIVDNQGKKNPYSTSNNQFLASASFVVGDQGQQNQIATGQNPRPQLSDNFHQAFRVDNLMPKTKDLLRVAQSSPTLLNFNGQNFAGGLSLNKEQQEQFSQSTNAIAETYKEQNQRIIKAANEIFESTLQQLKQLQKNQNVKSYGLPMQNSNGQQANQGKLNEPHLQNLGTRNVEIANPNLKPSEVNPMFGNSFQPLNFYGSALTTPFPIFSTTIFETSMKSPMFPEVSPPLSVNSYVDSLTEVGAKDDDSKTSPTTRPKTNLQDHRSTPLYNPINFVPSPDLMKHQKTLNGNSNANEFLLRGLSLVPFIPGGNFDKNPFQSSYQSQNDLFSKPKLNSDLQKYAEEMFKESLKTIYNSQKWNLDHKPQSSDISSIATSPNDELSSVKFTMPDIKPSNQILEAHFTEHDARDSRGNKVKATTEESKKHPQPFDIAELLGANFKLPSLTTTSDPDYPRQKGNFQTIADYPHPDFKSTHDNGVPEFLPDYLTPPKPNAFISKSPFNEFPPKRRPSLGRRPPLDPSGSRIRGNFVTSFNIPDTASSNSDHSTFPFDDQFSQMKPSQESKKYGSSYQNDHSNNEDYRFRPKYPTFTTSNPLPDHSDSGFQNHDFNHPRTHNLMGLLRKNKRLPNGIPQNSPDENEETNDYFTNVKPRQYWRNFVQKSDDDGFLSTTSSAREKLGRAWN